MVRLVSETRETGETGGTGETGIMAIGRWVPVTTSIGMSFKLATMSRLSMPKLGLRLGCLIKLLLNRQCTSQSVGPYFSSGLNNMF